LQVPADDVGGTLLWGQQTRGARQGNTVTEQSAPARVGGVEVRSIDYVPLNERHGKLSDLGPLWFMSNAQIATLAVGLVSITSGGNLLWSLIAIVSGTLIGTFFMAFHSAQGPQLGLPQMIQSRPQFGYVGALLVWLFAYLQYAGFNIFNTALAAQALDTTVHGGQTLWIVVVTLVALVIALVGYDFIHRFERWLAIGFIVIFGIFTVGALVTLDFPAGAFDLGTFSWTPFLAQFGVVAGYQISWAIYVSDYSRYLPPDVTVRKTFYWTYWGSALGAIWLMCLGTVLAGAVSGGSEFDTVAAIKAAGDGIFSGFGSIVLIFSTLGLISVTALNMYGGSLTLISAIDSLKKVRPTVTVRVITIAFTALLSLLGALAASQDFLANFENFLLLVLYLFIPWTAVNLVDYFIVRRGHYAIAEIFNPHGIYGRWGWRGIVSYLAGFAAMVPFFSTGLYTGPIADALGGADLSLFVGLPVAGVLYWVLARSIDVEAETRIAMAEAAELEEAARRHEALGAPDPHGA
jgi:NCS1 family nucleobase:cation symporter-1